MSAERENTEGLRTCRRQRRWNTHTCKVSEQNNDHRYCERNKLRLYRAADTEQCYLYRDVHYH